MASVRKANALLEQRERLFGQHAAGQGDVGERRLSGDLGVGHHDLVASSAIEAPNTTREMPHQTIAPMHIGHDSPEV